LAPVKCGPTWYTHWVMSFVWYSARLGTVAQYIDIASSSLIFTGYWAKEGGT